MAGQTTRRGVLVVLAGAASLGGCQSVLEDGGSGESVQTATATPTSRSYEPALRGERPEAPVESASVGMTCLDGQGRYYFVPSVVWLAPGGSLTWSAQSHCRQRTVAYHPANDRPLRTPEDAEPWASPVLQGSGSFEHVLERPGVYDAFGLYESMGQVATVLVGRPSLEDQPAMAADGADLPAPARDQLALHHRVVEDLLA